MQNQNRQPYQIPHNLSQSQQPQHSQQQQEIQQPLHQLQQQNVQLRQQLESLEQDQQERSNAINDVPNSDL